MINRVFYNGDVYYKVADLAELFEVSSYKMRKSIKTLDIGTTLKGFGRCVFVLEKNVRQIELKGNSIVIKTNVSESVDKILIQTEAPIKTVTKREKAKNKGIKKGRKKKNGKNVVAFPEKNSSMESMNNNLPQSEYDSLIKRGLDYFRTLLSAGDADIAHEICDKHIGKGKALKDTTLDDIERVRLAVAELEDFAAMLIGKSDTIATVSEDLTESELHF